MVPAHTDRSIPMADADTENSALMAGSSPAGIISTVTVANTATARVERANHGVRTLGVTSGTVVVSVMAPR
jgi:hypothetical protein